MPKISLNDTLFIVETKFFDKEKIGEPSLTMSKDSELQIGGETLKNNNNPTVIRAYIIRNFIKILERIQLSWKVNHQPHKFLKVQAY